MGRLGKLRVWLFGVLLALTCCARPAPRTADSEVHAPARTLEMHGDTDFTGPEREALLGSVRDLEAQTAGYLRIVLTFDLDFRDQDAVIRAWKAWSLVRVDSSNDVVKQLDARCDCSHLGFTAQETPAHRASERQMVLVVDRLPSMQKFLHVGMHELLHAAGLDHVTDPRALMFAQSLETHTTCMHKADTVEFCRVVGCRAQDLKSCT